MQAAYTWEYGGSGRDVTENGKTGTLQGNASTSEGVLTLNGAGSVDTGFAFGNGLSAFTASAWVKADSWTGNRSIIGASANTPNRYLALFANAGRLDGVVADGSTTYGFTAGATTLSTGVWYHIVYTFSGGSITGYIDAVVDANYPQATGLTAPTVPTTTYIGARNLEIPTDQFFDGQMGEVRLYNRALTAAEVQTIFNDTRGDYI